MLLMDPPMRAKQKDHHLLLMDPPMRAKPQKLPVSEAMQAKPDPVFLYVRAHTLSRIRLGVLPDSDLPLDGLMDVMNLELSWALAHFTKQIKARNAPR